MLLSRWCVCGLLLLILCGLSSDSLEDALGKLALLAMVCVVVWFTIRVTTDPKEKL